ncbi:MAG: DUF1552 domain-containing protein [Deltaproteobacteria bacterium]|nr:DUF1552 domain-containing protein [Deltaproteobacteria bacterium]
MIGLPFLASLRPRLARGAEPIPPRRFIAFYLPCGIVMNNWTPSGDGAGWTASPILTPLEAHRSKLQILTGLDNTPGRSDGGGDHAAGTGSFLTCTHVRKTAGSDIYNGISVDQMLAPVLSDRLPLPSLELGTDGGSSVGDCDTGYSCSYARSIAWSGPTTPLPKQTNPAAVFDRLFAGYDPDASAADIAKRQMYRTSVLDGALAEADSLRLKLGRTDQSKLDEYMSSVRDLEVRIAQPAKVCRPGARPDGDLDIATRSRAMIDLMGIAIECDLTRVITFMLGNAGSGNTHPQIGVTESHHELSHHMNNAANLEKLTLINRWEMEQLAYLLTKLDAIDDGNGITALDNSVVFCSSEIEDGDAHRHTNMPVVVAGGGGGTIATGVHRRYTGEPVADLFIALLGGLGLPVATFGDNGTKSLAGIRVG